MREGPGSETTSGKHGVLLTVAYDGTPFAGWAPQRDVRTVSDTVLAGVRAIDAGVAGLRGASRTDAGVHARGQLAAFDTDRAIDARGWVLAVNANLPDEIAVRAARAVPVGFNPRFVSRGKRYRYRLLLDPVRDPLLRATAWRVPWAVNLDRMRAEARDLVGTHDFAAFRTSHDERASTERTLARVDVEQADERVAAIVVVGDAFLHNMVRILAGMLVDVGRGQLELGTARRAFASKRRGDLGVTAPAHGLVLEEAFVDLPAEAGTPWPP